MSRQDVETELLEFVRRRFATATRAPTVDTLLFREGIVDSIGVLELVQFIETQFEINIPHEELVLENFQSVAAMCDFVERSL